MGHKSRFPLAHRLPSERATTFTDHSDLSTPVDAGDGHRPAAQASPSAASVQSLSLSVPLSSANTSARKPLATVVQVAREREKRHARAKRCMDTRDSASVSQSTPQSTDWGNRLSKVKASGGGQGGSKGGQSDLHCGAILLGPHLRAFRRVHPFSEAQRLAGSAHAGR